MLIYRPGVEKGSAAQLDVTCPSVLPRLTTMFELTMTVLCKKGRTDLFTLVTEA